MHSAWFSRAFFLLVAAVGVTGLVSGLGCTRYGKPGPIPPTLTPLSAIYVNARTGSDTSGNGSQSNPYKSLTKAVAVLTAAKSLSTTGVAINLSAGNYSVANGEKFPIVIPLSVKVPITITGSDYGISAASGTFINGYGQDQALETLIHGAPRSAFTTLEAQTGTTVALDAIYVGASKAFHASASATYASFDAMGSVSVTLSSFGVGGIAASSQVSGVIVPGGSFTCASCALQGNQAGILGFSVTVSPTSPPTTASPSPPSTSSPSSPPPSSIGPTISLSKATGAGASTIVAKEDDIATDGSVTLTVSGTTFEQARYGYVDSVRPIVPIAPGGVDFGGGVANSSGLNSLIGARVTEIWLTRRDETLSALGNTWNAGVQGANGSGQYVRFRRFGSGASGRNITIAGYATGSTVAVGRAPVPTPTPSVSPSTSPTASPT
jgi:Protein of unknown function (DUF1565)